VTTVGGLSMLRRVRSGQRLENAASVLCFELQTHRRESLRPLPRHPDDDAKLHRGGTVRLAGWRMRAL
jgi:hypothetical protein